MSPVNLIPWILHSALEYTAAVLLMLAPFLFGFEDSSAKWASIGLGLLMLLAAAITKSPLGVAKTLEAPVHATLDYVGAGMLILTPFVLGFVSDEAAVSFFVLLGVAHAAMSLLTHYPHENENTPADAS